MHSTSIACNPPALISSAPLVLRMARATVPAGFASPALDYDTKAIDLTAELVVHAESTFLVKVSGSSMTGAGIDDGDMLVVDRLLNARHGDIVVAMLDGEVTVKYLQRRGGRVWLKAANPAYADIVPEADQVLEVWGVVTSCIKRFVHHHRGAGR